MRVGSIFAVMLLVGTLSGLTGCCTPDKVMGRYDIVIELDEKLDQTIEVRVVGVAPSVYDQWSKTDVNDLFAGTLTSQSLPGNAYRKGTLVSKVFPRKMNGERTQEERTWTIPATDPIWDKWNAMGGMPYLFVITDLSQTQKVTTGEGNTDFRRKIVPLDEYAWCEKNQKRTKPIEFRVESTGITPNATPSADYAEWAIDHNRPH